MQISTVRSVTDTRPITYTGTWTEIAKILVRHSEITAKENIELFSLAEYRQDGQRRDSDIVAHHGIILDFDHISPDRAVEICKDFVNDELSSVIYTTFSYTEENPRFRIVVPYTRPVSTDQHHSVWSVFRRLYPELDPSSVAASRPYYLASHRPGVEHWSILTEGPALDPTRPEFTGTTAQTVAKAGPSVKILGSGDRQVSLQAFVSQCKKWAKKDFSHADAFGLLAKGLPFAETGHRDETLFKVCSTIADKWPDVDVDHLSGHFQASLSAMASVIGAPTLFDVRYKLARAIEAKGACAEPPFSRDDGGRPIVTVRNLALGLEAFFSTDGRNIYKDIFRDRIYRDLADGRGVSELSDADLETIAIGLDETFGLRPTGQQVAPAIGRLVSKREKHPVQEYLQSTEWDGVSRLDTWLTDYLGVSDAPDVRTVGRLWLIQAVARILQCSPNAQAEQAKADYCLVLEGAPGLGKSRALAAIATQRDWFTDNLSGIGTREAVEQISGKWIIEIAELAGLRRADQETIKAFISRETDRGRPAYGRYSKDWKRWCVFAATTNDYRYLSDPTGARRFWPVRVTETIDIDRLKLVVDQLWAEATALYLSGAAYWPTSEEQGVLASVVEERRIDDPWEDILTEWAAKTREETRVSCRYLLQTVILSDKVTKGDSARLWSVIQSLGWKVDAKKRIQIPRRLALVG